MVLTRIIDVPKHKQKEHCNKTERIIMKITITIPKTEIDSALTLSQEANTKSFLEYIVPGYSTSQQHLSGVEKLRLVLGLEVVKYHTFKSGIEDVELEVEVAFTKKAMFITLDLDLLPVHDAMRVVYADPEGFKQMVIDSIMENKGTISKEIKTMRKNLKTLNKAIQSYTPEMANEVGTTTTSTDEV